MTSLPADGQIPEPAVSDLRDDLRGTVILPDDPAYDDARSVWNAMIEKHPAAIVRARGPVDVMAAVAAARENGLELAVKAGGHNVAGTAVCNDGLVIDCSEMDGVRVDPDRRVATVGPGALLADLDRETQAHGLATPLGFVSQTGVAGLTLGGGFGYLSRKHGLTVDNLRSVDLVTADAELVHASEDENPDLFWGLRGGGGNFGVATAFEFDLHPLGPTVLAGPVVHAFDDAPTVLREVADAMRTAPDEVACLVVLRHAPPAPFLPEAVHGEKILLLAVIYAGDPDEGEAALAPLRDIGDPIADAVGPRPYTAFQSAFDAANEAGARNYWKAHYLPELTGGGVDVLCERAAEMTSPESAIGMLSLGGAVSRTPRDATAYPHRDAEWVLNVQARWRDPDEDERHVAWAREVFAAMVPHATGGVYVNFISDDEGDDRVRAAYGESIHDRLASIKAEWDPENVFRGNQNVEPEE